MSPFADRTGQAVLASRLGSAHEAAGTNNEALKKYADMLAFETLKLNHGFRDPYSSTSPIITWHTDAPRGGALKRNEFDPLVGTYPPIEDIVGPYITFGTKHPSLVKKEDLERVKQQVQNVLAVLRAQAAMDTNVGWQLKEQALLGVLRSNPEKGLARLKQEIAERKILDSADPVLANSINLIGYQLMLVGLYSEAENFMTEAIALREKQGTPGRYGLGNSLSNLGVLYLEEDRLSKSRPLLTRALELRAGDPSDQFAQAKTQIALGRLLASEGNRVEAEVQLKKAADMLKVNNPVPEKISTSNFHPTREPIPVFFERRAIRAAEQHAGSMYYPLALLELGALYLDEKKYEVARAKIAQAQAELPPSLDLALDARVNEKLGRIDTATGKLVYSGENGRTFRSESGQF